MRFLHVGLSAGGSPLNGLQRALMNIGFEYDEIYTGNSNINDIIREKENLNHFDLVWMQIQRRDIVSIETLKFLKDKKCFTLNWTGDKRQTIPSWMIDCAPYLSLTTFSNQEDVDYCNGVGIKSDFLEIGYDETIYSPIGEKIFAPEIVFLGNNNGQFPLSKYRSEMIDFLTKVYGSQFGLYGNGWRNNAGTYMGNQIGEAKLLRSAKIVINLSHFDSYTSDRLYRSLGSGSCVLSHRFKGIEKFEDKNELVIWGDFNDLKDKIDFYLTYNKERERIAKNGNKLALEKFTFNCMAENIKQLYLKYKA